jgi:histidinol-phosphate aminotransferase
LVFISNPNNPTGTMVDGEAISRFLQHVPEHVVTVLDEAYVELLPLARQPDALPHVRAGRKVVILRTFSKTYGLAGLRVGYAVAPEECIQLLHRVRQPFNVTAVALIAAEAALKDDRHVARTRAMVSRGLRYLGAEFERMGLPYVPSVANFILVEVKNGRMVFQALEREGVIVRPMDGYGLPNHVRITVGTPTENRRLIGALKKVLAQR